jgi:hypothetical protein
MQRYTYITNISGPHRYATMAWSPPMEGYKCKWDSGLLWAVTVAVSSRDAHRSEFVRTSDAPAAQMCAQLHALPVAGVSNRAFIEP